MPRSPERNDVLQGTLDLLVLRVLQIESLHGWDITERLQRWSGNVLNLNQGSLYPALYRLEGQGMIRSEWRTTENNRRARYYSLTAAGKRMLAQERRYWERMSRAVNLVLRANEA